jgi:hypothetical protein
MDGDTVETLSKVFTRRHERRNSWPERIAMTRGRLAS